MLFRKRPDVDQPVFAVVPYCGAMKVIYLKPDSSREGPPWVVYEIIAWHIDYDFSVRSSHVFPITDNDEVTGEIKDGDGIYSFAFLLGDGVVRDNDQKHFSNVEQWASECIQSYINHYENELERLDDPDWAGAILSREEARKDIEKLLKEYREAVNRF